MGRDEEKETESGRVAKFGETEYVNTCFFSETALNFIPITFKLHIQS